MRFFFFSVYVHSYHGISLIYSFIYTLSLCRGYPWRDDSDSSRAPGLTSGLQGSVNFHLDALLLVPQRQCISPFVFYILEITRPFTLCYKRWHWYQSHFLHSLIMADMKMVDAEKLYYLFRFAWILTLSTLEDHSTIKLLHWCVLYSILFHNIVM